MNTERSIPARSVPLSVPGSRRTERCYAMQGKGRGLRPHRDTPVELVLVDATRDVWNVLGLCRSPDRFEADAVPHDGGWRILGWRMADGSMPYADYDIVDPELAQIDHLPEPSPIAFEDGRVAREWPGLLT